jgi:hypothetical protein
VDDDAEGPGWRLVRSPIASIDELVPEADWFWGSLQRECVPGCCGLDAYDFSAQSVAWACGWGSIRPDGNDWRSDHPGDWHKLAGDLRAAAQAIRALDVMAVSGSLFQEVLSPEAYAELFEDLAAKAEAGPSPQAP